MNTNIIRRSLRAFIATTTIALSIAALAGCAPASSNAEPVDAAPSADAPSAAATPTKTPEPEFASGDVVSADEAKVLNDDVSDLTVAYPIGDEFIVLKWGDPVPEEMRLAVEENVKAATPGYGTTGNPPASVLHDALTAESQKLGGVSVAAVLCGMGATSDGGFTPMWAVSEPGPVGPYPDYATAFGEIRAWAEGDPATRTFVLINNLGCAQ